MSGRTVESLQRELLAIARGGQYMAAWARVNGMQGSDAIDLRGEMSKLSDIQSLRRQIKAIDPKAALYYGWGGHGDSAPCARCDGAGIVSNGELTGEGGVEYSEPIKCFTDCPVCRPWKRAP